MAVCNVHVMHLFKICSSRCRSNGRWELACCVQHISWQWRMALFSPSAHVPQELSQCLRGRRKQKQESHSAAAKEKTEVWGKTLCKWPLGGQAVTTRMRLVWAMSCRSISLWKQCIWGLPRVAVYLRLGFALARDQVLPIQRQTKGSQSLLVERNQAEMR